MSSRVFESFPPPPSEGDLKPQLEMFSAALGQLISTYGTPGQLPTGDPIEQVVWGDPRLVAKYRATRYSTDATVDPVHLHTVVLEKGQMDRAGGYSSTFVSVNSETGVYRHEFEPVEGIEFEDVLDDYPTIEQILECDLSAIGRGFALLETKYANTKRDEGVPEGSDYLIALPQDDQREWFLLQAGERRTSSGLYLAQRAVMDVFTGLSLDGDARN